MPRRLPLLLMLFAALATSPAAAQPAPVQVFAPLIGGVWEGAGEAPALGRFTVERTHEFALGGRYLRVRQTLTLGDGRMIEEETFIGWDPEAERFTLWGFSSDGSRSDALGESVGENRFVFTGHTYGAIAGDWRLTAFIIDETSMSVLLEVKSPRGYEPAFTIGFRRRTQ